MAPTAQNDASTSKSDGPTAKCCMGVVYFNRTMERIGASPRCIGLSQSKQGVQAEDDLRVLSNATSDFKYVCLGYSSHPTGYQSAKNGGTTNMPFCEGIEIAVTEEMTAVADAAAPAAVMRETHGRPTPGQGAAGPRPLPPAAGGPADSDEGDRSLQARFRRQWSANTGHVLSALTGERPPQLPVQLKSFDSVSGAASTFTETAGANVQRMSDMAQFLRNRSMDGVKAAWERWRSEEETE